MKQIATQMRALFAAAVTIMAGAVPAAAETTLCSYTDGTMTNVSISGTTAEATAKYLNNKTSVPVLQLKNGYLTEEAYNSNSINLTCEGGFKAGDQVTVQGFFNNSDETKKSAVQLFSLGEANAVTPIHLFPAFINGRTSGETPEKMQYVLTEDYASLCLGREGNTGTNLMYITVVRDPGTPGGGDTPVDPTPDPDPATDHSVKLNPGVDQLLLTTTSNDVKCYNTATLGAVDFDSEAGSVTVTPQSGDWADEYVKNITALSFAKAQAGPGSGDITEVGINVIDARAWLESVYATWEKNTNFAGTYKVMIKGGDYKEWTAVDQPLVRNYGTYARVDVPGLPAGTYSLHIYGFAPDGAVSNSEAQIDNLTVLPHDRSGFAFKDYEQGVGAYTMDGRLKKDAVVIYVGAHNAKTVTCDIQTATKSGKPVYETKTGLQDIIYGLQKGEETRPICIRVIGTITADDMDRFDSSSEGLQIKGKSAYSPLNLTIEGVGDDATIHGFGFLLRNSTSVELANLGILWFMDDAVSIDTDNSHLWIHHLDLFYGQPGSAADQVKGDGTLDIKGDSQYTTFAYNHLWDSGKASLCGMKGETGPNYIDYHHNWFDHSDSRHPRIRTMTVHVWNNYFDGVSKYGVGAAMDSNAFMESNYFRHTKNPALSSKQGTDIKNDPKGTFSGENGGIVKSFGNVYTDNSGVPVDYRTNNVEFDVYEATTRDEQVPAEVKAKQGGRKYDNFDTDASLMHVYTPTAGADVPGVVTGYYGAGRLNKGDLSWDFAASEDTNYNVITGLQTAVKNYKSKLVGIFE